MKNSKNIFESVEQNKILTTTPISKLLHKSFRKYPKVHPIRDDFSLFTAFEIISKVTGAHRIPVINKDRQLVTIITQKYIGNFINSNIDKIGNKKDKKLSDCKNAIKKVLTVSEDTETIYAFNQIHLNGYSGVAVVNKNGELINALGIRDLKLHHEDKEFLPHLFLPLKTYFEKFKKSSVFSCKPYDTIEKVCSILNDGNTWRLYITDDKSRPIGIISLKDVVDFILND